MQYGLALGVLLGNWLFLPLFTGKPYRQGFVVGLIAAGIVLLFYALFPSK